MAFLEFSIPINKEDLQSGPSGQYVVEQIFSKHELPGKLRDAFVALSRNGPSFVLEYFDSLYSALVKFDDLAPMQQNEAWKIVCQAIQQLNTDLDKYFSVGVNDSELSRQLVTVTKMTVYLLCSFLQNYETRNVAVPGSDVKGGRKKKKQTDDLCDMESERNFALVCLDQLVQMPIHKLWSPPVVEQDFVNLVSNVCYKVLENPVISHVKMKGTRESVFRVLGFLVKRYNHGLSCTLKIIQLLQHFEHAVPACVHGLITLVDQFSCGNMVVDLVREIDRVDPKDLARDTSSSRNYASFLAELAEKIPAAFIPCISLLSVHLDEESFAMRNSVLSIFAEIILQELSGESLDEKKRDLRDQLMEPLLEHVHDVNAFVRSKVLQLWYRLCSNQAIPLTLQHRVLVLTTNRLKDKSSNVRKHAIQLLIALMQGNPYAARLPLEEVETKLKSEQEKLDGMLKTAESDQPPVTRIDPSKCGPTKTELWNAMEPEILVAIQEVLEEEENSASMTELTEEEIIELINKANYKRVIRMLIHEEEDAEEILYKMRSTYIGDEDNTAKQEEIENLVRQAVEEEQTQAAAKESQAAEESPEISQQRMVVAYLKDTHAFANSIHEAIPVVCQLLCSKHTSDILEAVNFFVTAFQFDVLDAMVGVRRMLSLIWSSEVEVKDAVVKAYKELYMDMDKYQNLPAKRRALKVVANLTALISCSTQGELASLEELISLCVKTGDLRKECVQVLWEKFSMTLPDTTEDESRAALMLLAMVASAQTATISTNKAVLVKVGLGERGAKDSRLAHLTCAALLKMAPTKASTDNQAPIRFQPTDEMFHRVKTLLLDGLNKLDDVHYCQFASTAVSLIYQLAEHPDTIIGEIIKEMCKTVYANNRSVEGGELEIPSPVLTRILVIAGQVAIKQLVHLDVHVYCELRRRTRVREEKQEETSKQKRNLAQSASRKRASIRPAPEPEVGEEDELVGAVADDEEAEFVRKICETEIVNGEDSFLSRLAPLVKHINSNPIKYSDPALRAAASLCLAEFMLVSPSFCADNLRLLFTVLERSPEEVIRSNLVIALGDLNFRFPNLIEPWTPHLYGRLRDESQIVKRTTLNVLTHLILNDMVKVKGQISDIALCIIDQDARISGMSRMFFSEFARKGNALYNVMPDIISRLCDPDAAVPEDNFQVILKWIMALIQKEKQSESLVEKIILRLGASRTERQSRDLMFCLSLLSFSERSLRRILENWNCISDKIHEATIADALNGILSNAKKMAKQEVRALVEEIEKKIADTVETAQDEQQVVKKATQATNRKPSAKKNSRRKTTKSSSEEDDESPSDEDEPRVSHPAHVDSPIVQRRERPNGRAIKEEGRGRKPSKEQTQSSDEESGRSSKESVRSKNLKVPQSARSTRKRHTVTETDSDNEFQKPEEPRSARSTRSRRTVTETDSDSEFQKPAPPTRGKANTTVNSSSSEKRKNTSRTRR